MKNRKLNHHLKIHIFISKIHNKTSSHKNVTNKKEIQKLYFENLYISYYTFYNTKYFYGTHIGIFPESAIASTRLVKTFHFLGHRAHLFKIDFYIAATAWFRPHGGFRNHSSDRQDGKPGANLIYV
jgi:hypothetical protein